MRFMLYPLRTLLGLGNVRRVQDNRVPPEGQQGQQVRPGRARSPRALGQPPQRSRHPNPIYQAHDMTFQIGPTTMWGVPSFIMFSFSFLLEVPVTNLAAQ